MAEIECGEGKEWICYNVSTCVARARTPVMSKQSKRMKEALPLELGARHVHTLLYAHGQC